MNWGMTVLRAGLKRVELHVQKWATQYKWNEAVFGSSACTASAEHALPLYVVTEHFLLVD